MDNQKLLKLNELIKNGYECLSFLDFLKLAVLRLHDLVMYDSGMFFCAISRDCSYFKPYISGSIEEYYKKQTFKEKDLYLAQAEEVNYCNEAYVYKAVDYRHGVIQIANEPRGTFLASQESFHIVCLRIVHKGQFLGEIYLHRSKDKPDFDEEDMFALRLLQPHISTIFSIIHTVTAVKYLEADNQPKPKKGMCIFDYELSLIGGNVTALEMMKTTTCFGSSVLYHIKELCLDLMAEESDKNKGDVLLRSAIFKAPGNDLKLDIFMKKHREAKKTEFITIMEFCNEEQLITDYKFKFSKREAEIIDSLVQGKNNAQIANNLNLSENTIKTHIKNIYKKTGANNRTELTYVLMLNR